jgi:hypothetical protein
MAGQLGMGDTAIFLVPPWRDRAARWLSWTESSGLDASSWLVPLPPSHPAGEGGRDATVDIWPRERDSRAGRGGRLGPKDDRRLHRGVPRRPSRRGPRAGGARDADLRARPDCEGRQGRAPRCEGACAGRPSCGRAHSHRFLIVDYDASTGRLLPPVDLTDPKYEGRDPAWSFNQDLFKGMTAKALENSASFHAQNAYAIAARTLAAFEFALGRRLPWAPCRTRPTTSWRGSRMQCRSLPAKTAHCPAADVTAWRMFAAPTARNPRRRRSYADAALFTALPLRRGGCCARLNGR